MKNNTNLESSSNVEMASKELERVSPNKLITALRRSTQPSVRDPKTDYESCEPSNLDLCTALTWAPQPEATVFFRQPIVFDEISGDPDPIEDQKVPVFACNPFDTNDGLNVYIAIDILYEQNWHFRQQFVSSLANTIALAPNETLHITLRNTQRKQFDRLNVEEAEQALETESTFVDKDILNVTRSSAKTSNWTVSGNGSFGIGSSYSVGVSGSFSESYNESSTASAESVQENTVRSAENLRTLQKAEIREITEITEENTRSRTIVNPYSDRSLRLNIFNLSKQYCVEFRSVALRPVMIVELLRLKFDRSFVLANCSFLDEDLMDAGLRFELSQALEAVTEFRPEGFVAKLRERALLSLRYLFVEPNLFNLDPLPSQLGNVLDPNLPENSFTLNDATLSGSNMDSGFTDALDQNFGTVFTALGMFFDIYKKQVEQTNDGELALEMALALETTLSQAWTIGGDTQDVTDLLNNRDYSEIFRRVSGFLSTVSGMIKPLLQPAEEEREAAQAAKRAELVIDRVVKHLNCYAELYTQRFLNYIAVQSRMHAIFLFIRELIANEDFLVLNEQAKLQLLALIEIENAFIDHNKIIVPSRNNLDVSKDSEFTRLVGIKPPKDVQLGVLSAHDAIVPADGFHIEPVAGTCVLDDIVS
jgi:hypothetical protein